MIVGTNSAFVASAELRGHLVGQRRVDEVQRDEVQPDGGSRLADDDTGGPLPRR
jgi:hypothetical protein